MKALTIALALASIAWGQNADYLATASTTALTIQQPAATDSIQVNFDQAWIYCAAEQTATLKWNGTAASATTLAVKRLPTTSAPATATAWSASNVGSGTTGPTYVVPAGLTYRINLAKFHMNRGGTSTNLTLSTTGTCTITMAWNEAE